MTVPVKVVFVVRKTGRNVTTMRNQLVNNEALFTTDCTAALVTLEPTASFVWDMRVFPGPTNNTYQIYPKCEVTLPSIDSPGLPLWVRLRAVRNAIRDRLDVIASADGWSNITRFVKTYGGS